jgi:hypothetical protein
MNEYPVHEAPSPVERAERLKQIRLWLPGQMRNERLEAARLYYGPLYPLDEIRRRVARTLRWRLGHARRATADPIEKYVVRIPDEALLKYGAALERGIFSRFWVVTPRYNSRPEADPWIVAEVIGPELCAVIAQW